MRYIAMFLLAASVATAYIPSPDSVLIDGRMLRTSSRPMATFPWKGAPLRLSEHPFEASDARELEAFWEIKDGRLYLFAVSTFRSDGLPPSRSLGLRDLMPERIHEGRVFAEWFTGNFDVLEMERLDPRQSIRPENALPMRMVVRKFHVASGLVTDVPNQPSEPTAASGRGSP